MSFGALLSRCAPMGADSQTGFGRCEDRVALRCVEPRRHPAPRALLRSAAPPPLPMVNGAVLRAPSSCLGTQVASRHVQLAVSQSSSSNPERSGPRRRTANLEFRPPQVRRDRHRSAMRHPRIQSSRRSSRSHSGCSRPKHRQVYTPKTSLLECCICQGSLSWVLSISFQPSFFVSFLLG